MRKLLRRSLLLGALAGAAYAAWRAFEARREATGLDWQPQPFPFPPVATEARTGTRHGAAADTVAGSGRGDRVAAEEPWREPVDGECPDGYEVKVKLSSGIYHVEGDANFARTIPDRCYRDATAAEADGFRPPKR